MRTKVSLNGAEATIRALDAVGKSIDRKVMGAALKKAAEPMEQAMRNNAPVGKGYERVSLKKRSNDYRRGGATKRDVRTKVVYDTENSATVLVGVSSEAGKVGWRTHFTEKGTSKWKGKPFIQRTGERTAPKVIEDFKQLIEEEIDKKAKKAGL